MNTCKWCVLLKYAEQSKTTFFYCLSTYTVRKRSPKTIRQSVCWSVGHTTNENSRKQRNFIRTMFVKIIFCLVLTVNMVCVTHCAIALSLGKSHPGKSVKWQLKSRHSIWFWCFVFAEIQITRINVMILLQKFRINLVSITQRSGVRESFVIPTSALSTKGKKDFWCYSYLTEVLIVLFHFVIAVLQWLFHLRLVQSKIFQSNTPSVAHN